MNRTVCYETKLRLEKMVRTTNSSGGVDKSWEYLGDLRAHKKSTAFRSEVVDGTSIASNIVQFVMRQPSNKNAGWPRIGQRLRGNNHNYIIENIEWPLSINGHLICLTREGN